MDSIAENNGVNVEKHAAIHHKSTQIADDTTSNTTKINTSKGWTPLWLRKRVLITFIVLFVAIFAALQVLYSISQRNQGLATSNDNYHYLWTYGPTAILTIVVAFWRQVDYHGKLIIPWTELASGPTTAEKSLLLDYISPIQLIAFIRAVRNRHGLIILTTICFLLLNLIIVFSTGLFMLTELSTSTFLTLQTINGFDGSSFDPFSVDSRPVLSAYGVMAQNLPLPNGTTEQNGLQYCYQQFQPMKPVPNAAVTGQVDVLDTDMDCETGTPTWSAYDNGNYNPASQNYYVNLSYPSGCHIVDALFDAPAWIYYNLSNITFQGSYGTIQVVNCTNQKGEEANRLLVMLGYSVGHFYINTLTKVTNVLCKPKYSITRSDATFNTSSSSNEVALNNLNSSSKLLTNVSEWEFGSGVMHSLTSAETLADVVGVGPSDIGGGLTNDTLDTFSYLLTIAQHNITLDDLYNVKVMEVAVKSVFNKIGVQMANRYLISTQGAEQTFVGKVSYTRERLVVRQLSLRAMQAILVVLVICTLLICFIAPRGVVSRDPESIGSLATIFASSKVINIFNGTGHLRLAEMKQYLAGRRFQTVVDSTSTFFITEAPSESPTAGQPILSRVEETKVKWWRPIAVINVSMITTLVVPLALIATLEAVYHQSKEHDGLSDLDSNGYVHYAYVYVPAVVMVCLSTLFITLDSAIKTIQPYHALRLGTHAYRSILDHPLGKMTLPAAWDALHKWQPALLATSFGALLAPLLTILVSGLFTSRFIQFSSPALVRQVGILNLTWTYDIDHMTTPPLQDIISSLLLEGNLSYPQWTYDQYVFANYEFVNSSSNDVKYSSDDTLLNVTLPALRGVLNCSAVDHDLILSALIYQQDDGISNATGLFFNISTPDGCGNQAYIPEDADIDANMTYPDTSYRYNLTQVPDTGYFGSYYQAGGIPGSSCPTVAFFYGHVSKEKLDDLTVLFCSPYYEQVNVTLHVTIPDLVVDVSQPPQTVENSTVYYSDDSAGLISGALSSGPTGVLFQTINITGSTDELADVFQAMCYGENGIPVEELRNTTTLKNALQSVIGVLTAQTISIQARPPAKDIHGSLPALNGTIEGLQRVRLEQNMISTRILDAVLGAMFLCAVLAYLFVDSRQILADSPGSIAGVASLLAGSQIITRTTVPKGAEWWSDGESRRKRLFAGSIFSLGWWGQGETKRYGIDIGKAETD